MSRASRAAENRKLANAWRASRETSSHYKESYRQSFGEDFVPPVPTPEERKKTAYHEAGHAVRYQLGGMEINFVTALPYFDETRGWAKGITVPQQEHINFQQHGVTYIEGTIAGPVASKIYASKNGITVDKWIADGDYDQLKRMFLQLGIKIDDQFITSIEDSAEKFFQDQHNWECVEKLAALLQIQDKVTGQELKQLLELAA